MFKFSDANSDKEYCGAEGILTELLLGKLITSPSGVVSGLLQILELGYRLATSFRRVRGGPSPEQGLVCPVKTTTDNQVDLVGRPVPSNSPTGLGRFSPTALRSLPVSSELRTVAPSQLYGIRAIFSTDKEKNLWPLSPGDVIPLTVRPYFNFANIDRQTASIILQTYLFPREINRLVKI